MIHIAIVEDERLSAERLKGLVEELSPEYSVVAILDSVETTTQWLKDNSSPDLILLDIQLNDGVGFDLLADDMISCPVIFTTAYDEYAVKAFKYNSVDYLLKPIDRIELGHALEKFRRQTDRTTGALPKAQLEQVGRILTGNYKKRFLVKLGDRFQPVTVENIAYFFSQNDLTCLMTREGDKWPLDQSLDQLQEVISPLDFFRINRKLIISLPAIKEIHSYFNSRLLLRLNPPVDEEVIVSRERVANFKRWMDL
ncbi:MAG: LytTR family DNA-binding domain-containing protein [Marinoscillum sp.]|uniref:LytR/AlgR family response regulator transcription factor n=1 Tax=Marinoscillum sp. TaxID=2024838 RepID=UPI0032F95545